MRRLIKIFKDLRISTKLNLSVVGVFAILIVLIMLMLQRWRPMMEMIEP